MTRWLRIVRRYLRRYGMGERYAVRQDGYLHHRARYFGAWRRMPIRSTGAPGPRVLDDRDHAFIAWLERVNAETQRRIAQVLALRSHG